MSQKLNRALEEITGAYIEEAPQDVAYPYKVFSAKRLSEDNDRQDYILEINIWDQNRYYSRAESMMDALEEELHKSIHLNDFALICIFKGQRQTVPDSDKSIKRVREQFIMHVYERKG